MINVFLINWLVQWYQWVRSPRGNWIEFETKAGSPSPQIPARLGFSTLFDRNGHFRLFGGFLGFLSRKNGFFSDFWGFLGFWTEKRPFSAKNVNVRELTRFFGSFAVFGQFNAILSYNGLRCGVTRLGKIVLDNHGLVLYGTPWKSSVEKKPKPVAWNGTSRENRVNGVTE